jgi:predicted  nucleic acid-binding Zn-ribbon protein
MKKIATMTMIVSLVVVSFGLMAYADDVSTQMILLEQRAQRVAGQIEQAKQQSAAGTEGQTNALTASIDSLIKQRVQLDSAIGKLESQLTDLKQSSNVTLSKQMQQYQTELDTIKQQMASLAAKKTADAQQALNDPAKLAPVAAPAPAQVVAPAPVAAPAAPSALPGVSN